MRASAPMFRSCFSVACLLSCTRRRKAVSRIALSRKRCIVQMSLIAAIRACQFWHDGRKASSGHLCDPAHSRRAVRSIAIHAVNVYAACCGTQAARKRQRHKVRSIVAGNHERDGLPRLGDTRRKSSKHKKQQPRKTVRLAGSRFRAEEGNL